MGWDFLILAAGMVHGTGTGSVCIASVPGQDDRHSKSMPVATPPAEVPFETPVSASPAGTKLTIRIDTFPTVQVDARKSSRVSGIALVGRHRVVVLSKGKPTASFRFRFSDYETPDLCLWYKWGYGQWVLDDKPARIKGCTCGQ